MSRYITLGKYHFTALATQVNLSNFYAKHNEVL